MAFGYAAKPNFAVDNEKELAKPPKVDFTPPVSRPQVDAAGATK